MSDDNTQPTGKSQVVTWWESFLAQHPPPRELEEAEATLMRTAFVAGAVFGSNQIDLIRLGRPRRYARVVQREGERVAAQINMPANQRRLFWQIFLAGGEAFIQHYAAALQAGDDKAAEALIRELHVHVDELVTAAKGTADPSLPLCEQWWLAMMEDETKASAGTTREAFLRAYFFAGVIFGAAHENLLRKGRHLFDRKVGQEVRVMDDQGPWHSEEERHAALSVFGCAALCHADAVTEAQRDANHALRLKIAASAEYAAREIEKLKALMKAPETRERMN